MSRKSLFGRSPEAHRAAAEAQKLASKQNAGGPDQTAVLQFPDRGNRHPNKTSQTEQAHTLRDHSGPVAGADLVADALSDSTQEIRLAPAPPRPETPRLPTPPPVPPAKRPGPPPLPAGWQGKNLETRRFDHAGVFPHAEGEMPEKNTPRNDDARAFSIDTETLQRLSPGLKSTPLAPPPIPRRREAPKPPPLPSEVFEGTPGDNARLFRMPDLSRATPPPLPPEAIRATPPPLPHERAREAAAIREAVFQTGDILFGREEQLLPQLETRFETPAATIDVAMAKGQKRTEKKAGEDAAMFDAETGLQYIGDGMGGMGGDPAFASREVGRIVREYTKNNALTEPTQEQLIALAKTMRAAEQYKATSSDAAGIQKILLELGAAPREIRSELHRMFEAYQVAKDSAKQNPEFQGSTTIVLGKLLKIGEKKYYVYLANGDSGIDRVSADGNIEKIAEEQNLYNLLRGRGNNPEDPKVQSQIGMNIPKMKLATVGGISGTGKDVVAPQIGFVEVFSGDTILLRSDGLTDVEDAEGAVAEFVNNAAETNRARAAIDAVLKDDIDKKHDDKVVLSTHVK